MRTVTRTINVYKFLELGPAARDKARNFIADDLDEQIKLAQGA